MRFTNRHTGLSLEIEQALLDSMIESGRQHCPMEFGGVLVGYYSNDKRVAIATDFILPQRFQSSPTSFLRGDEGLKEILKSYFEKTPSQIYLGEWHTHPDSLPIPSSADINSMNEIYSSKDVNINLPLLIIIGLNRSGYQLGIYSNSNGIIRRYEKD